MESPPLKVNKNEWFKPQVKKLRSPFWWLRWVPTIVLIFLILEILYVVGQVAIIPVLASCALAYMLNPLVQQLEKRGLSRSLATVLTLMMITLLTGIILTFIIPDLIEQGAAAGQKVMREFIPENAERQRALLKRYAPALDRMIGERVQHLLQNPSEVLGASAMSWAVGGLSGFFSTALASLDLLLVPFFVYYILIDFRNWRVSMEELIPPRFREPLSRLFDETGRILEAYVRGQLLISLIMVGLYGLGFVGLKVPAWAGIAALAGLLNIIPYVGTVMGLVCAEAFTLADGGGLWRLAGVLAVFVVVQMIEGYVLTPRIIGSRLSLHPMAVFLGLLIGGKLFGLLGIVLAVPTIAIAKVFLMFLRELYKGSNFYRDGNLLPAEAETETLEERLAEAADTVLAEQVNAQIGDELLAPST